MDNTKELRHLGICTGYGGIERGIELSGQKLRTLAHVEIEAFAIKNLVDKMESWKLDTTPIWTDIKTLPMGPFRGVVDLLTGGYPCQPFSHAGRRLGKDDGRHLWPWICRIIDGIMPRMCFFENVEGHITLGLRQVLADLESRGYKTTWGLFSAAEVGAPHQRKRLFILADSNRKHWGAHSKGRHKNTKARPTGKTLADTNSKGLEGRPGFKTPRIAGFQQTADGGTSWPSRPGERQYNWEEPITINDKLNPDWVEQLMGLPVGWTGKGSRIDRLRLLGNGVVPQTACKAWTILSERIGI